MGRSPTWPVGCCGCVGCGKRDGWTRRRGWGAHLFLPHPCRAGQRGGPPLPSARGRLPREWGRGAGASAPARPPLPRHQGAGKEGWHTTRRGRGSPCPPPAASPPLRAAPTAPPRRCQGDRPLGGVCGAAWGGDGRASRHPHSHPFPVGLFFFFANGRGEGGGCVERLCGGGERSSDTPVRRQDGRTRVSGARDGRSRVSSAGRRWSWHRQGKGEGGGGGRAETWPRSAVTAPTPPRSHKCVCMRSLLLPGLGGRLAKATGMPTPGGGG